MVGRCQTGIPHERGLIRAALGQVEVRLLPTLGVIGRCLTPSNLPCPHDFVGEIPILRTRVRGDACQQANVLRPPRGIGRGANGLFTGLQVHLRLEGCFSVSGIGQHTHPAHAHVIGELRIFMQTPLVIDPRGGHHARRALECTLDQRLPYGGELGFVGVGCGFRGGGRHGLLSSGWSGVRTQERAHRGDFFVFWGHWRCIGRWRSGRCHGRRSGSGG